MIKYISLSFLLLQGCSSIFVEEIAPSELQNAGVQADPFYINKNISKIDSISYSKFLYKDGRYYLKEDYEKIQETQKEMEKENLLIKGDLNND